MTQEELLDKLHTFTAVEHFYREYYLARQVPKTLREFLDTMDSNFIEEHHLQIPDAAIVYNAAPYPEQTFLT
ncbi:MAG TPA: hypothetical protein DF613_08895 [Lachnospiraceae bacterium]|nr:hypothetical protein [Lachnospiraceae bacterium]